MKNKKTVLLGLLFVLLEMHSQAQFTVFGTDPACVRWRQQKQSGIKWVFPDFRESSVAVFRQVLQQNKAALGASMQAKDIPFSVLFHPYASANGLVVWTPKRMEINLTPPLDGSAQPWLEQLALHEYRHMKQMQVLNSGLARVGYPLVGQISTGLMSAFLPRWLAEGDAVMMETALSRTGRGRQAQFDMPMRALLADSSMHYSYDKMLLGSYQDLIPGAYVYGYHFTAYVREHYGADIWQKVIRYVSWRPYLVHPKSFALKKYTGKWTEGLQNEAWKEWRETWSKRAPGSALAEKKAIDKMNAFEPGNFVSYSQAFAMPDSALIYLQSDRKHISQWIRRNPFGQSYPLCTPGTMSTKAVCSDPYLVWAEDVPHPRYEQETYSVLRCLNIYTKEMLNLDTRHWNRVQALCFGPHLDLWVLSITDQGKYRLECVSMDSISTPQKQIITSKKVKYAYSWEPVGQERITDLFRLDSLSVGFLTANESGKHLEAFHLNDSVRTPLMGNSPQWNSMQHTFGTGNEVLFCSDQTGVDNIYAYSLKDAAIYRLTNARFGAFYPAWDSLNNRLWVTDYTSRGEQLLAFPKDSCLWEKVDFAQRPSYPMAEMLSAQELALSAAGGKVTSDQTPSTETEIPKTSYRGLRRSFNVHSWLPVYFDPSSFGDENFADIIAPGVTLMSQNLLGNLYGHFGYAYKNNRNTLHTTFSYRRFWPILSVSGHYNEHQRSSLDVLLNNTGNNYTEWIGQTPSLEVNTAITFPYQSSKDSYNYGILGQLMWSFNNDRLDKDATSSINYKTNSYADLALLVYVKQKMAELDIQPRVGIQVNSRFRRQDCGTTQVNMVLTGWLPGFDANHSVRVSLGYEHQNPQGWYFEMMMAKPRFMNEEVFFTKDYVIGRVDYTMPLWYPDVRIPSVLYLKRVFMNAFGEFADDPQPITFLDMGCGADLWTEFHFLHFAYPIQAGIRMTRNFRMHSNGYQAMISLPF